MLTPWLDNPTPASLEFLTAEGERETKNKEDQTYFVYELLTASGQRYQSRKDKYQKWYQELRLPKLPTSATKTTTTSTLRRKVRKILRPEEYARLEEERRDPSLSTALETAYQKAGFWWDFQGASLFGIDEDRLQSLLYVPANTAAEADAKIQEYRQKVNALLRPRRLSCDYKIRPLVKGN